MNNFFDIQRFANIYNTDSNTIVNATEDDDYIRNSVDAVTINALGGHDSIYNYGSDVSIDGGDGSDVVYNKGNNVTIEGGAGIASIENCGGSNVEIYGGVGNDTLSTRTNEIYNRELLSYETIFPENVLIDGGDGNDNIVNYWGDLVTIKAGAGDDIIHNGHSNNVIIDAGAGDDIIYTSGDSVSIDAGDGRDYISNHGSATIDAGAGNDSIYNNGDNVTIDAGAGNDSIINSGKNVYIDAGAGNDSINIGAGSNVSVDAGEGDNYIVSDGENLTIYAGAGDDSIFNSYYGYYGDNVTIDAGAGDDYIYNRGDNVTIDAGAGNDDIDNRSDKVTIDAGEGNDYIYNIGDNVTIDAGAGNDSIENSGDSVSIDAGAGDDIIYTRGDSVSIDAGAGDDSIFNSYDGYYGDNVTIDAGAGDDYISLDSHSRYTKIKYTSGDGNDTIYDINSDDTLQIKGGTYSTLQSGDNDILVKVGEGSILLKDALYRNLNIEGTFESASGENIFNENDATLISGTDEDDTISNSGNTVQILAQGGNDSIYNSGENVSISGGADNDTVENAGNNVSIDSGEGKNIISNSGLFVSINGGYSDDSISNSGNNVLIEGNDGNNSLSNIEGSNVTINGGYSEDTLTNDSGNNIILNGNYGNDNIFVYGGENISVNGGEGNDVISISGGKNLILYNAGEDNDTIFGITENDTLKINGANYAAVRSGNDMRIIVGDNSILLKGAANTKFNIDGTQEGNAIPNGWKFASSIATASISSAEHLDLTEDYGAGIIKVNGTKLTKDTSIIGNEKNNSIKGGSANDTLSGGAGNDTLTGGKGNDIFIYSGGNDLITDFGTGADIIQFNIDDTENISAEIEGANLIYKTAEGNLTVKNGNGKDITIFDSFGNILTPEQSLYIEGTAKADNLNNENDDATINALGGNDKIYNEGNNVSISGGAGNDKITLEEGTENITVNGGAGNDSIYNEGSGNLYQYASGDGKDTIIGFNDNDTLQITKGECSYSVSGNNFVVKVGAGTITLKDSLDKIVTVMDAAGNVEIFPPPILPPSGWKFGTSSKTNTNTAIITATISSAEKEIDLNDDYGVEVEKVDAVKISDSKIIGNDLDNSIKTGGGNDELDGGAGNDTLTGGKGDDIFIYSGGDDVITDYGMGNDSIQIASDIEFTAYETLKSDAVYYTNEGTLIIKNAVKSGKVKNIILMDESGEEIIFPDKLPAGWQYNSAKNEIIATVKSTEDIDLNESYGAGVEVVDGAETNGVKIFGNDLDNSIKGGTGNNTLAGGAGNDTLDGNTGADVFIYSEGDDRIINYSGNDSIQIDVDNISKNTTEKITREIDGEDVIYYIDGAGMLTVQNAKDQKIILTDANGTRLNLVEPPTGWTISKNILRATVASAENEIDLTEEYGDGIQKVDAVKISGGVEIYGNDLNNSLKGGRGNDYLDGGSGNDTLTSGTGDDLFIYTGGDDYITDYAAGKDSIQVDITEIEIYSAETIGANVLYHTDAGNITVKNGKGKNITLIDADGDEIIIGGVKIPEGWQLDSSKHILKATVAGADNEIDLSEAYGANVEKVDAVKISGGVEIYGNNLDNSIKSGKGNDILDGGAGNDTLTGGAGADTYFYSGGDDVITDYSTVDAIQFDTENISITNRATVGSNVIFTTDAGALIVKNAKTKKITLLDYDGEDFSYTNSSKNVAEKIWFLEDDNNFVASDIDSITENKFAVTEIQSYNEDLAQDENILTFAKDK